MKVLIMSIYCRTIDSDLSCHCMKETEFKRSRIDLKIAIIQRLNTLNSSDWKIF